jgi:hypothetical protein
MEEQGLIWWSQGVPPRQRTKARRGHICKKIKKKRKGLENRQVQKVNPIAMHGGSCL